MKDHQDAHDKWTDEWVAHHPSNEEGCFAMVIFGILLMGMLSLGYIIFKAIFSLI